LLPTFVIGLREGFEAALIVGIIAAFLGQRGERQALRYVWFGVVLAVAICAAAAVGLYLIGLSLPFREREIMEGILALAAVAGVTYMIVWMRGHARALKQTLESEAAHALVTGSSWALVGMAFLAVLREGLETAVFMLAAFQSSNAPLLTGFGAVLGVIAAIGLGYAIFRGGLRINMARFFGLTGFVLVLVAAGLLATAVHDLAEAGVISLGQQPALDLSWLITPGTIQAALLTGLLGFQPVPSVAELAVWLAFAVPMSLFVLLPHRPRPATPSNAQPEVAR
jgi:high-affinity iron transporter